MVVVGENWFALQIRFKIRVLCQQKYKRCEKWELGAFFIDEL